MSDDTPAALGALRVDEGKLKGHVDEVVRSSVEETLNAIGYEDDGNLYAYVKNDPLNSTDPTGLTDYDCSSPGKGNCNMSAPLNAGDTVEYGGNTYNISAVNGRQVSFSVDTATSCGMEQTINTSLPGSANSPNGAAGLVSQTAGLASAPAAAMEHASGKTRVGSNGRLYSANKSTGRVFNGNKYVSTTSVAKLGRAASRGVAGVSQAADTVSVLNGDMSGGKYLLNTGVGALGLLGGPGGAATAITYFGGDAVLSIFAEEATRGIASPPPTIVDLPY